MKINGNYPIDGVSSYFSGDRVLEHLERGLASLIQFRDVENLLKMSPLCVEKTKNSQSWEIQISFRCTQTINVGLMTSSI